MRIRLANSSFLVVLGALLACKQSDDGAATAPGATAPDVAVVAGVGVGGSLAAAEQDALARAAKGETTLVAASLSGATELCVAIAWKTPLKNRRALFATIAGPVSAMRSQRVEPGPTRL